MKNFIFAVLILASFAAFGRSAAKSAAEFIPAGFVVFDEIRGDLNKDNQLDTVFVIKGTARDKFYRDEYRGVLDRNRRGIVVALKAGDHYTLALENRACFSSEHEDGGVYFAPDLNVEIDQGILRFHYAHGRYGFWSYKFRYQNDDFELIGFDRSENHGPVIQREVSINLLTKKMQVKENINPAAESGEEKFIEHWKKFTLQKPIKLRDIEDFDALYLEDRLGLNQ